MRGAAFGKPSANDDSGDSTGDYRRSVPYIKHAYYTWLELPSPGAQPSRAAYGMIPDANPQSVFGRGGNELLWESVQDHAPVTAEVADQVSTLVSVRNVQSSLEGNTTAVQLKPPPPPEPNGIPLLPVSRRPRHWRSSCATLPGLMEPTPTATYPLVAACKRGWVTLEAVGVAGVRLLQQLQGKTRFTGSGSCFSLTCEKTNSPSTEFEHAR